MGQVQKPNSTPPAQGAGATAEAEKGKATTETAATETAATEQPEAEIVTAGELQESEAPEWVQMILDSNQAVIDSNQAVIEGIKSFVEKAGEVVSDIVAEAKGEPKAPKAPEKKVELNPESRYVVSKGNRVQDRNNPELVYKEGDDVTKLENDRLENLLSQGVIEEA